MYELMLLALIGAAAGLIGAVIRLSICNPGAASYQLIAGAGAGALAAIGAGEILNFEPAVTCLIAGFIGYKGGALLFNAVGMAITKALEKYKDHDESKK